MGHYENGGSNAIGVATTSSFAAVWTVDTPYIDVLRRDFFDLHKAEIVEACRRGEGYSDDQGQTGAVEAINTDGGLDESGWPKGYSDPSEYVAAELEGWARSNGEAFERAIAEGYTY